MRFDRDPYSASLRRLAGMDPLGSHYPGAPTMLQAVVTATLSFLVFTIGSLLVAIQVASA
jgi:hypothetical protein